MLRNTREGLTLFLVRGGRVETRDEQPTVRNRADIVRPFKKAVFTLFRHRDCIFINVSFSKIALAEFGG